MLFVKTWISSKPAINWNSSQLQGEFRPLTEPRARKKWRIAGNRTEHPWKVHVKLEKKLNIILELQRYIFFCVDACMCWWPKTFRLSHFSDIPRNNFPLIFQKIIFFVSRRRDCGSIWSSNYRVSAVSKKPRELQSVEQFARGFFGCWQ